VVRGLALIGLVGLVSCGPRAPAAPRPPPTTPLIRPAPVGGPPPCNLSAEHQFDFWVGRWRVDNRRKPPFAPGEPVPVGTARDAVARVLGCTFTERWRGVLAGERVHGVSVRQYDRAAKRWRILLHWPSKASRRFGLLDGGFAGAIGTFGTTVHTAGGRAILLRFTFSDVHPGAVRWTQTMSADGGATWDRSWVMDFHSDPAGDAATPAPDPPDRDVCPEPAARAFDFLVGDWVGRDAAGRRVAVHGDLADGGCTSMDMIEVGGAQRLDVRGYDPALGAWVQYEVEAGRGFRRWAGAPGAPATQLASDDGDGGGPAEREVWTRIADGQATLTRQVAGGPGGWTTVEVLDLRRGR
jgi:hypothetical protein